VRTTVSPQANFDWEGLSAGLALLSSALPPAPVQLEQQQPQRQLFQPLQQPLQPQLSPQQAQQKTKPPAAKPAAKLQIVPAHDLDPRLRAQMQAAATAGAALRRAQ